MELFRYSVSDVNFMAIGQPIIDNATKRPVSFEIISRLISVGKNFNLETYFRELSHDDITQIASIQLEIINGLASGRAILPVNLNIHYKLLFNDAFISRISNMSGLKLIFEINDFEFDENFLLSDLRRAFYLVKSQGHQIWLDDYTVNNETASILSALPWDGVKIDKSLFWQSSQATLFSKVKICKCIVDNVIIQGVDGEFLYDLSKKSLANYSQGFHWKFLSLEQIFI